MKNVIILMDEADLDLNMKQMLRKFFESCLTVSGLYCSICEISGDISAGFREANKTMDGSINFVVVLAGNNLKDHTKSINFWADKIDAVALFNGILNTFYVETSSPTSKQLEIAEKMFQASLTVLMQQPAEQKYPERFKRSGG